MSNQRKQQLMQEALDETLSEEAQRELRALLSDDPEEAEQFNKLKQVDALLNTAPHERAPQRLALSIMARLAVTVQEQQQMRSQSEVNEASMQVALTLVTVATLPLMIGASYLLLNAMSNPDALDVVLQQVAALIYLVLDVMKVMMEEAQAVFATNPEAALALLALIPVTLLTLVKQVLGQDDEDDQPGEPA